ncbi:acetyltransferase [Nocardiopsis coralliicola]
MNTPVLRPVHGPEEFPALVAIWRSAVEATHDFLAPADVDHYEAMLRDVYLPSGGAALTVAEVDGAPAGFSGLADGNLDMLFVDAAYRGSGVGSTLLRDALARHPDLRVDVNEQNPQALGFYLHHGFHQVSRSPLDGEGRPFPLLHLAASGA